jgi:hypothetical protein
MASSNAQVAAGTPFAPQALVPVSVGHTMINLYPVVDHTMLVHKRVHAFQNNKTACSSQAIDLCIMLDSLRQQLNLNSSVEGIIEELLQYFQDSWSNFCRLHILRFHNNAGNSVNSLTAMNGHDHPLFNKHHW